MNRYRITVDYDYDVERPDAYGIGKVVSFSTRHSAYQHPDSLDPANTLATLSYYEHGLCRWMVGSSTVPDYGHFDTVDIAGAIVFNDDATEMDREWYNGLNPEQQQDILDGITAIYSEWANGDCYMFAIERLDDCMECGTTLASNAGIEDAELGGIVGDENLTYQIREAMVENGIDPNESQFEYAGEASHLIENQDWGQR